MGKEEEVKQKRDARTGQGLLGLSSSDSSRLREKEKTYGARAAGETSSGFEKTEGSEGGGEMD